MRKSFYNKQQGFNLLELMVVISLIGFFVFAFSKFKNISDDSLEYSSLSSAILELANLIDSVNEKGNVVNIDKQYLSSLKGFPHDIVFRDNNLYFKNYLFVGVNIIPLRIVNDSPFITKRKQGFMLKPQAMNKAMCNVILADLWDHFNFIDANDVLIKSPSQTQLSLPDHCKSTSNTILFLRI